METLGEFANHVVQNQKVKLYCDTTGPSYYGSGSKAKVCNYLLNL